MTQGRSVVVGCVIALGMSAVVVADTLVLRNGRRVEGELVSVRGNTIEFEERRGWSGSTTRRYDREDVQRIELDRDSRGYDGDTLYEEDRDARPSGLREREVTVAANQPWTDAGIQLRSGQQIWIESRGEVRWGKDRKDDAGGESNSPRNPNRPIPNRNAAALIGKIGNDDPFFIGDEKGPIRVRSSGRLHLGINDDYLLDNSGSFRVTVYY